ncbi:MAG: asparagine synthase-related protein [Actinomycetes bacterium]
MCGIALIVGARRDPDRFRVMLDALRPRGDVEEFYVDEGLAAGTQRLRIVDRERAIQPWFSGDRKWLLCYNGEVFNHRELREELIALGREFRSTSDTEVVLESFLQWGQAAVNRLRGEFAFAIVERSTNRVFIARDPLGIKPLYWSIDAGLLHLASEVKALVPVGSQVFELPPGHCGWARSGEAPVVQTYVDLLSLGEGESPIEDPEQAKSLVRAALRDSIRVRVDTDLTVGVVLSGGLDSSITLINVLEMHPDCVAFTIGTPDSEDVRYARRLTAELGVRHEVIDLGLGDIRSRDVRRAIEMSELTEYGDIINAVVSVPLFRRVHELGIKVVLAGDGSDELFGGYDMYHQVSDELRQRLFLHKLVNLCRTELQRVDRTSMGQGVEVRVPFLDLELVKLAMRMPISLKRRDGQEKWILRETFADVLPDYIRMRPKNPMSHSSGLHERARLYRPGFARHYRSFGYDARDPMRRDFSIVLEQCDRDLDRALAEVARRPDYNTYEQVRDFVSAARWNVGPVARSWAKRLRK